MEAELKNRKKHLIVPLLIFTFAMMIGVTVVLMRVIRDFSAEQMRVMSENIIELLQEGLERSIREESLLELSDFNDDRLLEKMQDAQFSFQTKGAFTYEDIFAESPYISRIDRLRELFGIDADFHISMLSGSGRIIASSEKTAVGSLFMHDKKENRKKLEDYLGAPEKNESLMLFDHEARDMELVLVFPLERFTRKEKAEGIIVAAVFSHLNIYRTLLQERFRIPRGNLFIVNRDGAIFERQRPVPGVRSGQEIRVIADLLQMMLDEPDSPVLMDKPYRSFDREMMIATGIWVEPLDIGIVIEIQASEILAPWFYMSSLILAIVISSFLFFLIVLIYFDRHRLRAYDSNPITHLPGNRIIQKEIASAMKKKDMMVIYCDLDNFKAFNDNYGFSAGDDIIAFSAEMLLSLFQPRRRVFAGHIGGDDFVIIGKKDEIEAQARKFGSDFDSEIPRFYSEEDRSRGYIVSKDRKGETHQFPLVAMSMGAVLLDHYPEVHPLKIAEICSEVKKEAKKVPGSRLYIDQRSAES